MYFSTTILADLIDYAQLKSIDTKEVEVKHRKSLEKEYVDYEPVIRLLNHYGKALDDPYLGLHVGEQLSLKTTALVDKIMFNSETLESSIHNAIEYSKVISDALSCSFKKTDDYFSVIYEENPNWKVQEHYARRQILDMALLSNVKSLSTYTERTYFPASVNFHYPKPKHLHEYYRLFNCRLNFSQAKTEIIFDKRIFDKHSKRIEFGLLESLKEKVSKEIKKLPRENSLIHELKKSILNNKPERIKIREAAHQLHTSTRSLQRKLKVLNTTFKSIEYELQIKLAKTYLKEQQKSIDEISYLLGFSESSAFIRFFKSLTNQTPKEYQVLET